uniref:Uncharacterized protein n=1 Tax=Ixodes ricinus TaxID=34613 RepID=A0A0K8RGU6_IXORI
MVISKVFLAIALYSNRLVDVLVDAVNLDRAVAHSRRVCSRFGVGPSLDSSLVQVFLNSLLQVVLVHSDDETIWLI